MAREDGIEEKKNGPSWGKIALGTLAIGGAALVGLAVGGDDVAKIFSGADGSTITGKVSNFIGGTFEAGQKAAGSVLGTLTGGYEAKHFATWNGAPATPAIPATYVAPGTPVPAIPATEATLGITGVTENIGTTITNSGKAALDFARDETTVTAGIVGGSALAGVAGGKWATRINAERAARAQNQGTRIV